MRRPLILDLDFTLIHLEYVPDSIEVPGRTRSAFLAPQTVDALRELQLEWEIVLATARSWDGTRWVVDGLRERGVFVDSVVIEDGARLGKVDELRAFDSEFDAAKLRELLNDLSSTWPRFEWQLDFENCVVARCETPESAAQVLEIFQTRQEIAPWNPRFFRDGRKVYILSREADKWSALKRLLGARAPSAAGVGDGANDLVWLRQIAIPATFVDATAVVETVRARGGIVGEARGHEAIVGILRKIQPATEVAA